jgi:hypothetical protein
LPVISAGFAGNTKRPTPLSNIPLLVTNLYLTPISLAVWLFKYKLKKTMMQVGLR